MSWIQIGQDIDGEAEYYYSGRAVSLSANGTRVAIGASNANGNESGHVRVYELIENSWVQLGQDIDGEAEYDYSGRAVSLSADGTRVAIGAPENSGINGSESGHVRVYELIENSWVQLGQDIDGEAEYDYSGRAVSLSANGTRVAIGATENSGINGSNSGHVRVYELIENSWVQLGQDIDGEAEYDDFGYSVSLSADGSRVAIGAEDNDGNGNDSGHARVYELIENSWVQLGQDIDGEATGDDFGYSVSLSADGSRVAIGGEQNDANGNNSGHVRVYELIENSWVQLGQDIDGEAEYDNSGHAVSLSADGTRVAIGARYNSNANGSESGHVRVYELIENSWVQLGQDIDGEAEYDNSGRAVSLSANGTRVAIGALYNSNANGNGSGHVRVYEFKSNKLTPNLTMFDNISKVFGDLPFTLSNPSSNSTGAFTYTSSNLNVATISDTNVTIVGAGQTTITATQAETDDYAIGRITSILIVEKTDAKILKASGYTANQLKQAGYTVNELKEADYTINDLKEAGYTVNELKQGGYTANELKQIGYSLKDLVVGTNYTISELKDAGYIFRHGISNRGRNNLL